VSPNESDSEVLRELARVAADVGPALAPAGHQELLRSITTAAMSLFGARGCSLALLDEEREELVFHVVSGGAEEEVTGLRIPAGHGIAGWVVTSGQPIVLQDVSRDPRFARDVADEIGYTPTSIMAMPLETEREMLGVIEVLDPRGGGAGEPRDLELLAVFAQQAALAIENSRVFADLGRTLLEAAGAAAEDADLVAALERVAREASGARAELAELAAHFAELGRLGPNERRAATRLVGELLAYARSRSRNR
jgi:GAF domain-containing protein